MSDREILGQLLKDYSVTIAKPNEEFTLASGEKSRFYIDVRKTALRANAYRPLGRLLWNAVKFYRPDAVAGVVLGGCHLASLTAIEADRDNCLLDVVLVRKQIKEHGSKSLVEYPRVWKGERIVLIEDVVTTGNSVLAAAEQLVLLGFNVVGIVAVIDRRLGAEAYKLGEYPLMSLFTVNEFVDRRHLTT